jgi:hypothetical protein
MDMSYVLSHTGKKSRNLALAQILKSVADKFTNSTDFLLWATDLTCFDTLTCALRI